MTSGICLMAGLSEADQTDTWDEIARELQQCDGPEGFTGPCEMVIGVGTKQDGSNYSLRANCKSLRERAC